MLEFIRYGFAISLNAIFTISGLVLSRR